MKTLMNAKAGWEGIDKLRDKGSGRISFSL
jgi:hypothetical protein